MIRFRSPGIESVDAHQSAASEFPTATTSTSPPDDRMVELNPGIPSGIYRSRLCCQIATAAEVALRSPSVFADSDMVLEHSHHGLKSMSSIVPLCFAQVPSTSEADLAGAERSGEVGVVPDSHARSEKETIDVRKALVPARTRKQGGGRHEQLRRIGGC